MGLILDTSILIAAERRRFSITDFLTREASTQPIFICSITVSELLHGVARANTTRRRKARSEFVNAILDDYPVLAFDVEAARVHAELWATLKVSGTLIGSHDLLIAATALARRHSLATLNAEEFRRVAKLRVLDCERYRMSKG